MKQPLAIPLVYLITAGKATQDNFARSSREILALINVAVEERVDLVQIREKLLPARKVFELSQAAAAITKVSATRLLINDRPDVAIAAGADGVHLTRASVPCSVIRQHFPSDLVIGMSTHSLTEAETAAKEGADLAVFGPVFDTPGKDEPVGIGVLAEVCGSVRPFPILALGGIDLENYASVLAAGASGFAAIRALSDAAQIRTVCRQLRK